MCHHPGCGREQFCKGYCRSHYYRLNRYGDPAAGTGYTDPRPRCAVHGCGRDARIKGPCEGFCPDHGLNCLLCEEPCSRPVCRTCRKLVDMGKDHRYFDTVAKNLVRYTEGLTDVS